MKRVFMAVTLCGSLAACSGSANLAGTAAAVSRIALPAETVAKIGEYCRLGAPLIAVATSVINRPEARTIGEAVDSYCRPMAATGALPPTTDSNTVNWLAQNLGTLRALLNR